jgi:F-type H+-transporting ATPase subunit a
VTATPLLQILASSDPLHHVVDDPWVPVGPVTLLSKHIFLQLLGAGILLLVLPAVFGRKDLVPRGVRNFFEAICLYLRDEVFRPNLGEHTDRFTPFLWTLFFFILVGNLLGMVPFLGTPYGNIWVTATLATMTMVMVVVNGIRLQGWHYIAHFNPGPLWLAPLLVPLEILGIFTRGFALAVRLFANMMAGHILLAVLTGLIVMATAGVGMLAGFGVALVVVPVNVAVSLLELFVAFLQAFIFTFLTALFLGQAVLIEHHGEEHGHGPDHGHGHDHRVADHAPASSPAVPTPAKH